MNGDISELHALAAKAQILRVQYIAGVVNKENFTKQATEIQKHMDFILEDEHSKTIDEYRDIINSVLNLLVL
jgi:hypothetical protein